MTRLSDGSSIDDWNRPIVPVTVEVYEPEPDPTLETLARVLDALEGLREALGGLPAPMVHVDAPNLDALLAAIANGTPPPSADAIAEAIAARTKEPESQQPLADAVKEAFDKLDKRLAFPVTRPASGGGSVSLANDPNRQLGHVTVDNVISVSPVSADEFSRIKNKEFADTEEVRYEIPASLVSASIYTGVAADGTATSAAAWTVIRSYFDANGNPERERIRASVVWDNRTSGWT